MIYSGVYAVAAVLEAPGDQVPGREGGQGQGDRAVL